jgi:multiple sugar transport system substrate-binding protein
MSSTPQRVSSTPINRRRLVQSVGAGAGALLAASASNRVFPTANAAPAGQDATTITFWTPGGSPTYCEVHTEIAADYTAVNPNVTVNFQCGTDPDAFTERLLGAIAGGNPPDATVYWDTPVSLGVRGALLPLDDLIATAEYAGVENWPPGVLASCQFGGQTWGLPVASGTYGIWYNQELFESKGIPSDRASFPKTWDELRALSKEFTQWDGDRLVSAGYLPWPPVDFAPTLPIWSALNGGQLYDAANQVYTIDAESNVAMMDYFIAWLDEEYQGDFNLVQRSGAWKASPSDEGQPPQFQAGHLAMTEWGSWGLGDFYAYGDPAFEHWEVAPYPVGPSGETPVSGYWPNWLVIPQNSRQAEAAFGYLDYMSGVGVVKWFEVIPDLPTNALVPETLPTLAAEKRGEEFTRDAITFFRDQLDVVTPMWDSPVQGFALDQLTLAIERILAKQDTAQVVLAEAQQACQAELESVLASEG